MSNVIEPYNDADNAYDAVSYRGVGPGWVVRMVSVAFAPIQGVVTDVQVLQTRGSRPTRAETVLWLATSRGVFVIGARDWDLVVVATGPRFDYRKASENTVMMTQDAYFDLPWLSQSAGVLWPQHPRLPPSVTPGAS